MGAALPDRRVKSFFTKATCEAWEGRNVSSDRPYTSCVIGKQWTLSISENAITRFRALPHLVFRDWDRFERRYLRRSLWRMHGDTKRKVKLIMITVATPAFEVHALYHSALR